MLGRMLPVALLLAFQTAIPQDSSAYLDPGARELVRRARERRASAEQLITDYHVRVTERISLGLRALRRDRTFYQRELAARFANSQQFDVVAMPTRESEIEPL